jgi:hypothetical protein
LQRSFQLAEEGLSDASSELLDFRDFRQATRAISVYRKMLANGRPHIERNYSICVLPGISMNDNPSLVKFSGFQAELRPRKQFQTVAGRD